MKKVKRSNMVVERYKNRELDERHKEINNKLDAIIVQTTKTNGRVSDLETSRDRTDGALRVIQILLVPILIALVVSFI